MSRLLGVACIVLVLLSALVAFSEFSWSWSWLLLAAWTIGLGMWNRCGWKKVGGNELGWRAAVLCFGQRTSGEVGEGWQWVPFPFGIKPVDCRARIAVLDTAKVNTFDNIEVTVGKPTIVWEIFNLNLFLDMNPDELPKLLDDVVDQNVRRQIRRTLYDNVVGMDFDTQVETLERWGIRVVKIKVSDILATDDKLRNDIQLAEAENRERVGQRVEMAHIANLVSDLMRPVSAGGQGLTQEQAYETALLITGKADPKKISGFTLDSGTAAALASLLGRRP
jgi:hypothetical protein